MEEKVEGIILRTTPYQEHMRIASLFTRHKGIISLLVRGLTSKKQSRAAYISPLFHGEFCLKKGRSDLYLFQDATPISFHHGLRQSYEHLNAAMEMLDALNQSQMPEKPAPDLFELFSRYLAHLPQCTSPELLCCSFLLKILKHEGLISISELCAHCQKSLSTHLADGEALCSACAPPGAQEMPLEIPLLANLRRFSDLPRGLNKVQISNFKLLATYLT